MFPKIIITLLIMIILCLIAPATNNADTTETSTTIKYTPEEKNGWPKSTPYVPE